MRNTLASVGLALAVVSAAGCSGSGGSSGAQGADASSSSSVPATSPPTTDGSATPYARTVPFTSDGQAFVYNPSIGTLTLAIDAGTGSSGPGQARALMTVGTDSESFAGLLGGTTPGRVPEEVIFGRSVRVEWPLTAAQQAQLAVPVGGTMPEDCRVGPGDGPAGSGMTPRDQVFVCLLDVLPGAANTYASGQLDAGYVEALVAFADAAPTATALVEILPGSGYQPAARVWLAPDGTFSLLS